jgi:hypothetical protein
MSDSPVSLTPSGPPETVLGPEPVDAQQRLQDALALGDDDVQRAAISAVVADYPTYLDGWARIGDLGRDPIEAYAAYRVGYHRGLDRLRQSGWRGSGYVRWAHETNRGFLRALAGLQRCAGLIGERDEEERCAHFLAQLDPAWPPATLD